MGLVRIPQSSPSKPKREPHHCVPIVGEFGRFTVNSRSAEKKGLEEAYIVDVLDENETAAHGKIVGTCPCKGYSVRGKCSHLDDAKAEHARIVAEQASTKLGFEKM